MYHYNNNEVSLWDWWKSESWITSDVDEDMGNSDPHALVVEV